MGAADGCRAGRCAWERVRGWGRRRAGAAQRRYRGSNWWLQYPGRRGSGGRALAFAFVKQPGKLHQHWNDVRTCARTAGPGPDSGGCPG